MSTNELSSPENDHTDPTQEPYAPRKLWNPVKETVSPEETLATSEDTAAAPQEGTPAHEAATTSATSGEVIVDDDKPALDLPGAVAHPEVILEEEFVLSNDDGELNALREDISSIVGDLPSAITDSPDSPLLPATATDTATPAAPTAGDEDPVAGDAAPEPFPASSFDHAAVDEEGESDPRDDSALSPEEAGIMDIALGDSSTDDDVESSRNPDKEAAVEQISSTDHSGLDEHSEDTEHIHTTTIPVADTDSDDDFSADSILPADVLEARDPENPSTTAIRRDLMSPIEEEEEVQTTSNWESVAEHSRSARRGEPVRTPLTGQTPESLDDVIFEGATVVPVVPSRTSSHLLSVSVGLLFVPLAWYLFADAGARMLFPENAPIVTGVFDTTAVIEFAGALGAMLVFLFAHMRSSLGAWVWGVVITILGLPWLIVPGLMKQHTSSFFTWLEAQGPVGSNLAHHIQTDAYSGRFLFIGVVLLALAIVAVSVRRRGRAEEALRARVEKVNPEGAYLNARERRRAAKEMRRASRKK